jgi:tight adherence protein C
MEWGFLGLVFVGSALLVLLVGRLVGSSATEDRARRLAVDEAPPPPRRRWIDWLARSTLPLARFSGSDAGTEGSALRRRLLHAGIHNAAAPTAFFGIKTLLAVALPLLVYAAQMLVPAPLQGPRLMYALLGAAALGHYLPNLLLARLVTLRQREIFESFPDALDLMTVCVEAGLGLEAALQRVANDMAHRSLVLSSELQLVGMELRAGAPREYALHNLALRTGVEEVDGFVSMVIQAERFGTSIAQALRVHADMLRTRRRQRAEEAAAKIAIKLLLPLVFCIFPALMLVLMGPAILRVQRMLSTMAGGG